MPDITRAVGAPRALIVPFGLGRPFGAPHDRDLQRRVLRALLDLLCGGDAGVMATFSP